MAFVTVPFSGPDLPSARKMTEINPALHLDEPIQGIALSADGRRAATTSLASASEQGHVWDVGTGKSLLGVPDAFSSNPLFSPDGNYVAFDVLNGAAIWDIRAGRPIDLPAGSDSSLVAFSPDSKRIAIHSYDRYTSILAIDELPTTQASPMR
jgi:WD40 repeat protein